MNRTDIINFFVEKYGYNKYLEIGTRDGINLNKIKCEIKHGVDPKPKCKITHHMTSDEFFKQIPKEEKYDIIFIDGLHLESQVQKDILNSLEHLEENGTIVVHDCNPIKEEYQREYRVQGIKRIWNGTTWKAFARLRTSKSDLEMYVINTDHGCGIIRRGSQDLFPIPDGGINEIRTYDFLSSNRKRLLNLISIGEFKERQNNM